MQSKWFLDGDIPQTDFDQRAVTLIHRGLISGYTAPRGSVCREKRLTKRALLKDIAADFALLDCGFPNNPPEEPAVHLIVMRALPVRRKAYEKAFTNSADICVTDTHSDCTGSASHSVPKTNSTPRQLKNTGVFGLTKKRMIQAMERVSGLKFAETELKAVIYEGPSNSGFGSNPMNLRASYPMDVKKATLVHELSHRMNAQLKKRPKDLDEHRILFLYLYDVWESLYGKDFADQQVEVEKRRKRIV